MQSESTNSDRQTSLHARTHTHAHTHAHTRTHTHCIVIQHVAHVFYMYRAIWMDQTFPNLMTLGTLSADQNWN